jgi:hypothetical protein
MALTLLKLSGLPTREPRITGPESRLPDRERLIREASPAVLFGQDPEGFRPIGPWRGPNGGLSPRDLQPPLHARMQQVAYYLYLVNPLAHRIVEHTTNYVIGDGVTISAEDPKVERLLHDFWSDRINDLDRTLPTLVKELGIFGEQCILTAVNPVNGRVRLGYLDPAEIEAIEWGELRVSQIGSGISEDSSDEDLVVAVPVAVVRRATAAGGMPRRLRIVRLDEDPESPAYGRLTGDCFYFAINKARAGSATCMPSATTSMVTTRCCSA